MIDQRPTIIWLNAVLIALTSAATCSRAGRRIFVVGKFSWHDALISLAAIAAIIFSIFQMVSTNLGLGLPNADVPDENMPKIAKLMLASNVFYFLCNWAVKHALLLFYAEITREKSHLISIYIMHFVAFGFGSSSILVNIFQCRPFHKAWDGDAPGYCVNLNTFFYFNSNIMLATDLVLYIMPVVFTRKLQLRKPQKIGLNCLFALGGLVLAASAARVWSVHMFATKPDFTWRFANAMIWSVIENHLAVVVACAPSVKVVILLVFPALASSLSSLLSKVTPSTGRSRSRASAPFSDDLESGVTRKSDKLKPTPSTTPLPSPAVLASPLSPTFSDTSKKSRASQAFGKWFKAPASPLSPMSPRLVNSVDSMEDTGLVYVEPRESPAQVPLEDIRVEHTIEVENRSRKSSD